MKVLLVLDQYDGANNGNTTTARRLAENLTARGHEVRIAAQGESRPDKWGFRDYHLPVFDKIVTAQGFVFATPDREKMTEAVMWADVVHIVMPFALGKQAVKIAKENNVPLTGAFHVQPENIWFSVKLGNFKPLITFTYWLGRTYIYKHFDYIHCPSNMLANELRKHHYKSELRVISNGFSPQFQYHKNPKRPDLEGKFLIVMSARLSREKRQDLLIEAVRKSKHSKDIQLLLAGQGPMKEAYAKQGANLPNPIKMEFFSCEGLIEILGMADLYCHPSDIDIESISCLEAIASGLVPIISDSSRSAASQFALDERSVFRAGDSSELARKIDYWFEHEAERKEMEPKYAEFAENYSLDKCVDKMLELFRDEIRRCGKDPDNL